jgi:hypothetical protein
VLIALRNEIQRRLPRRKNEAGAQILAANNRRDRAR